MSWALISDSSCNLRDWQPTAPHTTFAFAPLKIRVGEREFIDDLSLDVHELNCAVQAETNASSSACPSVGEWAELFKLADKTICMPISEGVSGSYNAAALHARSGSDAFCSEPVRRWRFCRLACIQQAWLRLFLGRNWPEQLRLLWFC